VGRYPPIAAAVILLAGSLAVVVRHRIAVVAVDGTSMEPALTPGDKILVRRAGIAAVRAGQVVVFERPGPDGTWTTLPASWVDAGRHWMIKRVAAIPGEKLPAEMQSAQIVTEHVVPAGSLVVLGDNDAHSRDSRHIGYIPAERIIGVMLRSLA
jgi:signal peptidase I